MTRDEKATFADIVADAYDAVAGVNPDDDRAALADLTAEQAAAILADPRLVELLAEALLAVEASDARRGKTSTCGEAAAAIIRSLGEGAEG